MSKLLQRILQNDLRRNSVLRCCSTKLEIVEKNLPKKPIQRQYVRPESSQVKMVPYDNFVTDLFKGNFNKNIFQFSSALQQENIDPLLKHSFEIESYINKIFKADNVINKDTVKEISNLEMFGLSLPQKYGGSGYLETEVKFVQECAGVNFNVLKFMINNDIGAKIINDFGSEEQKKKYLPRLASGKSFITLAYIENSPAIDLTTMEATAIYNEKNKTFILNGYKKLVHNANVSDLILLLTKTISFEHHKANYNMFIVEKNTPGITINQLKAEGIRDLDLFEISFDKVEVSESNLIESDYCGTSILKSGLGYGELGTATICLTLLKKLTYLLSENFKGKYALNKPLKKYNHVVSIMGELNAFVYALESVIYFCAERYDKFIKKSDMFVELIIPKIFAVEVLQMAIEKYVQILGTDCFKSKEFLDEAFRVLEYATTFNENILYLKLMLGNIGILEASKPLTPIIKKVKKPDENPKEFFQWIFREDKRFIMKKKLNLKMNVNYKLCHSADALEEALLEFEKKFKDFLYCYGALGIKEEMHITRLAEIVIYLYAYTVVLTRASNSIYHNLPKSEVDFNAAILFGVLASGKLNHLLTKISHYQNINEVLQFVGELSFEQKQYPVAHPLIKTY